METAVLELEEFQTEDIMSHNHAKITYRLTKILSQHDILPKSEFELAYGWAKPDVAICKPNKINWLRDIIRPTHPPLIAIEILSPRQALTDLTNKWLDVYFPSDVKTVWVIIPKFKQITVLTASSQENVNSGVIHDETTGISLDLSKIFAE